VNSQHLSELEAFGLAVRAKRQGLGISQDSLAGICGLHRTYIGSVERGERNVGLRNIHAIANALSTTAHDLLHLAFQLQYPVI
jgi:transcriptional regulator with XRE-family HTH domain